jgi:uncharacterized protein (DUF1499 family)
MNKTTIIPHILFISLLLMSCAGKAPSSIGVFANCPQKPNCVSTKKNNNKTNYIDPIKYLGSTKEAKTKLLLAINSIGSSNIKDNQKSFIYVEFVSEIFGFVDDVEFYFTKPGIIDFRSASRIGYSDLGVNRDRMETIRRSFNDLVGSKS